MDVIDIVIHPEGRTLVLFDCRDARPQPADDRRIRQAIADSLASAADAAPVVAGSGGV